MFLGLFFPFLKCWRICSKFCPANWKYRQTTTKAGGHIKGACPPCWFQLLQWESVNRPRNFNCTIMLTWPCYLFISRISPIHDSRLSYLRTDQQLISDTKSKPFYTNSFVYGLIRFQITNNTLLKLLPVAKVVSFPGPPNRKGTGVLSSCSRRSVLRKECKSRTWAFWWSCGLLWFTQVWEGC